MGSGKTKKHEHFTVAPALVVDQEPATGDVGGTLDWEDALAQEIQAYFAPLDTGEPADIDPDVGTGLTGDTDLAVDASAAAADTAAPDTAAAPASHPGGWPSGQLTTGEPIFKTVAIPDGHATLQITKTGVGKYQATLHTVDGDHLHAVPDVPATEFATATLAKKYLDGVAAVLGKCPTCGQYYNTTQPHTCPDHVDDPAAAGQTLAPPAADPDVADSDVAQPAGADLESAADLVDFQQQHGADALTPIPGPGDLTVGDGFGRHLIIGGGDFYDSAVTVISYQDPKDADLQRQVLLTEITPDAEAKLIEALNAKGKLVPKQVTETVTGPLPLDVDNSLSADITIAAKSINYHFKEQDGLPDHTLERIQSLRDRITSLGNDPNLTDQDKAMLAEYDSQVAQMEKFAQDWTAASADYQASGGKKKLPMLHPYEAEHVQTSTVMVPDSSSGGLTTSVEQTGIVYATLSDDGTSKWNGALDYNDSSGYQYKIDLGDGYTAYYKPRTPPSGKSAPPLGLQGQLEVVAPPGADDPADLVARLGRLHLSHEPLTQAETEWSYLRANVFAAKLSGKPQIKKALQDSEYVTSAKAEQLMSERFMTQAIGLNEEQLTRWSKGIYLEAERASLPQRTSMLRDAVAAATGHGTGDALLTSPDYKPVPQVTRVGVKWSRFDVPPAAIVTAWKGRKLGHSLQGSSDRLLDILRTGALASQSRRRRLGVPHTGMSEGQDTNTGGSRSIFLRNFGTNTNATFEWNNAATLLTRTDWYAHNGDHYGKHAGSTHDPVAAAKFTNGSNELMFFDGIDVYGPQAPTRIHAGHVRDQAIKIVKSKGITQVNGVPVEQWIVP